MAFLWAFPIAWIATYYSVPILLGALVFIGVLMVIGLFYTGLSVQKAIDLIVLLIVLGFIGTTMAVGALRNRSSKRLLRAQSSLIGFALRRVTDQRARNRRLIDSLDVGIARVGDAFRVRQVVDNVLSNAVKYAQRGGKVTVRGIRPSDQDVALEISDTGFGIAAEDLPRIFDPEFRTVAARESGIPGTGLGLGISRDIVAQHGGHLDVRCVLGHGTTVRITLPVRPEGAPT